MIIFIGIFCEKLSRVRTYTGTYILHYYCKANTHTHTYEYFARIVRRAMRVLLRSRSRCLFTRSMVPHMCSCMRGCVHAPRMRARVYNSEVGVRGNREKGMKGGTITVPRFRATTRRHPFNLHPRCRVLNQPAISLPLLSPFQLLLSPYP